MSDYDGPVSTTPSSVGSPDATPRENGLFLNLIFFFGSSAARRPSVGMAAKKLGLATRLVELHSSLQIESALGQILRDRPDAVLMISEPTIYNFREQIAPVKLPFATEYSLYAKVGMCLSYGPKGSALLQRVFAPP